MYQILPNFRISYDPEADVMYVKIREWKYIESDEVDDGIILDYWEKGEILGIEILDASKKIFWKIYF